MRILSRPSRARPAYDNEPHAHDPSRLRFPEFAPDRTDLRDQTRDRRISMDPPTRRNVDVTIGPVKRKVRKLRVKRPTLAECFGKRSPCRRTSGNLPLLPFRHQSYADRLIPRPDEEYPNRKTSTTNPLAWTVGPLYIRLTTAGAQRQPAAVLSLIRGFAETEKVCGCIAQLVEQLTLNQPVLGSNPRAPTTFPLLKSQRNSPKGAILAP